MSENSGIDPAELTAQAAAQAIAGGSLRSEELVRACLARIEAREPAVEAWTFLDADHAIAQARQADAMRAAGRPTGPLHGVPVGIKDIIDTADMPTEMGSPIHAGRRPSEDASVVAQLRRAGAVIMGKTVTTEFAVYRPGKTRNPHDPGRTPGGSSSGSAAAVACGMVPLALGSQTNGSVIRPASFCGTVGYKPTHGLVSRAGMLKLSGALDTVGVFARSVADAAFAAECLMAYDQRDPDLRPAAAPPLLATAEAEPPVTPQLAFVRGPAWELAEETTREAFAELVEALGPHCHEVTLPAGFDAVKDWHATVMHAEMARHLSHEYEHGREALSPRLVEMIEQGRRALAVDYMAARAGQRTMHDALSGLFADCDAVLTPAAAGEAPTPETTGNPAFCTLWTYLGTPAVSLPLLQGPSGLPLGVQLVGPRGDDARLLRTARWLAGHVAALAGAEQQEIGTHG